MNKCFFYFLILINVSEENVKLLNLIECNYHQLFLKLQWKSYVELKLILNLYHIYSLNNPSDFI